LTLDRATGPAAPRRTARIAIVAVHSCCAAALMWWSWRKWPDPLVDFGRELYVPWQLTRGKVLSRDIASLFGPLSPYLNALWFRLFGVSLTTLAFANLALLCTIIAGIYHLVRVSTDRVTAVAAGLTALLLFGFSQYTDVGNYNFISPYSHEATHGFALAVASLVALHHGFARNRTLLYPVAGLCFGATLLTKPEVSVAAAAALALGWIAGCALQPREHGRLAARLASFIAAAALAPLLFLLYFSFAGGLAPADAARAVAAAWIVVLETPIASNEFYLRGMGLDHPAGNALRMVAAFAGFVAFVTVAASLVRTRPRNRIARVVQLLGQAVLAVAGAVLIPRYELLRALPLISAAALVGAVIALVRRRRRNEAAMPLLALVMWSAFGFVLLAKMWLNARIYHYGFYLALPATTVMIAMVLWFIPHRLDELADGGAGGRMRRIMAVTLAMTIALHLGLADRLYRAKRVPLGSGADRMLTIDPFASAPQKWQGIDIPGALDRVRQIAAPGATLAVLPEGVILNYLLRRETPVPFVNFMPPELMAFGEGAMVRALERQPPDIVVFIHRDTSEYGFRLFGTDPDYGRQIMTWIRGHYQSIDVIGHQPMSATGFGIEILRRAR
jgi:Dolichyl-phosphate-mannose-protein mannosyltransferase